MRYVTLLAAALVCTSININAQNEVSNYPGVTNFTSRGNLATSAGEIHMGYHRESWRGIGQWNPVKTELIGKFTAVIQDQIGNTQETYNWVVRKGTDAKGPTLGKAGELYVSGALKTPTSTATGPAAWLVTHTLTSPITIPDSIPNGFFSIGLRLAAAKTWTTDGMSCHMAVATKTSTGTPGSEAGLQQKDHAWDFTFTATAAIHPSMKRVYRMSVFTKNPALQVGNIIGTTTKYGPGGLFPDMLANPAQGLGFRVNATGANGQVALVFIAGGFFPAKLPIVWGTRLYLHPTTMLPTPLTLGVIATNKVEAKSIPVIPSFLAKKAVAFQGLLIDVKAMKLTLTNAVMTQF